MADNTTVPHNVQVGLNVSGVRFRTSLNAVMEGARLGCEYFQVLCVKILPDPLRVVGETEHSGLVPDDQSIDMQFQSLFASKIDLVSPVIRNNRPETAAQSRDSSTEPVWNRVKLVPIRMEQNRVEHFIDADPTHFPFWLGYFRTRKVPYVEAGPLRQRLIVESEEAGLKDLADELRRLVDWRREDLQRLLVHRGAVLHGARLQGQDLSRLGFMECSLAYADLSGCNLSFCSFRGADLSGADLRKTIWHHAKLNGADLSGADLRDADLSGANLSGANLESAKLQGARLPPWSSGLLEGVKLTGAEGWMPADKDLSKAKLKGSDLSSCDLSGTTLKDADLSTCDMSGADLSTADLTEANLEGTILRNATFFGAILHAARGARPHTKVPVTDASKLDVGKPVVFALTAVRALTLRRVFFYNTYGDGERDQFCGTEMEVQTGPSATGPWTSVVKFTSRQTKQEQTFAAAPDAPLLTAFVQLLVHGAYGGPNGAFVTSMTLEGEAWGEDKEEEEEEGSSWGDPVPLLTYAEEEEEQEAARGLGSSVTMTGRVCWCRAERRKGTNPVEPPEEELESFKNLVNDYFKYSEQIFRLEGLIEERQKYSKELEKKIMDFMFKYKYNDIRTHHGCIKSKLSGSLQCEFS